MTSAVLLGVTVACVLVAAGLFVASFSGKGGMAGLMGLGVMLVAAVPAVTYATVADS